MLDPQNEIFDRRLARHLVSLYYKTREKEDDEILVSKFSIKYSLPISMTVGLHPLTYLRNWI